MASFLNTNVVSVISTQHSAITFLTDSIRRNMDAGQLTGAIFIDFHKAFDTIDHTILLDKLHLFGIYDSEHCWMTDYLILSATSDFWSLQSSILGPLLFSLYVTDLPMYYVFMYVDDTVIYYVIYYISWSEC